MSPEISRTKLEINFSRLLNRCEEMAASNAKNSWRLDKFVGALQEQLSDLRKASSRPTQETLAEYTRKVEFLKGLIEAEKMPNASAKSMAADLLAPAPQTAVNATPSRELHLQAKSRFNKEMRDELGLSDDKDGVRQRLNASSPGGDSADLDTVIKHHHQQQEKLATEMVVLAKSLKETANTANKIVKDDTQKLHDSNTLAEKNKGKLKTESERLQQHVAKSCNWWIWIMLVLVCLTFIWMVIFMRMFPKR